MKKSASKLIIVGLWVTGFFAGSIPNSGYSQTASHESWLETWYSEKAGNESDLHYATTNALQFWGDALHSKTKPKPVETGPPEPIYHGRGLSAWLKYLYRYNYQGRETNFESREAVLQIGTNALPLLLNWIAKPERGGWSAPDYAVEGFEVLGPVAKPAVPDLVKFIGQNQNYPERALVFIGKDAVPALANKLLETFSDTNNPFSPGGSGAMIRRTSGIYIRDRILDILNQMGTNAEAALPALIQTVITNLPAMYAPWFPQNPYAVLVNVGRNQPDLIIPILLERFNNPTLHPFERGQVADAISIFGTNQARTFLPVLIGALSENKSNDWSRIQIGGTLAVIGSNQPDMLLPVFLAALTDKNNGEIIRCHIAADLAKVGHNQPDIVVPALITTYTNSTVEGRSSIAGLLASFGSRSRSIVPLLMTDSRNLNFPVNRIDWKIGIAVAAKKIAPDMTNTLAPLIEDLENADGGIQQRMILAFRDLGTNGFDAVPALLSYLTNSISQAKWDAIEALGAIGVKSDEYINILGQMASDTNICVSGSAQSALCRLAAHSQLAFVIVLKKVICGSVGHDARQGANYNLVDISRDDSKFLLEALDDPDPLVRSGDLYVFYGLQRRVPAAIPKLRQLTANDPDANVRSQAADVLKLQLQ